MKRGINCVLPVSIGCDLDTIERIEFLFVQDEHQLLFSYPSDRAVRDGDRISLLWTQEETMSFQEGPVKLDTHIHLIGAVTNPETKIASFKMNPTLFSEEMLPDD